MSRHIGEFLVNRAAMDPLNPSFTIENVAWHGLPVLAALLDQSKQKNLAHWLAKLFYFWWHFKTSFYR
ncbi:hypothetical protein GRI44_01065 [Altererythrobacter confluentis]|uniref:Uncharacterized protein n=1 Tax=Allopontixanthobacter confluentis TaxID=1849021 RepID=A0A6L7GCV9_9SPHN|nr:hypothetical protein [Allopontixanthobacter confluentis]MXP13345.1 hypothetical protein [Allopontixanthobacter confluentis]